MSIFIISLALRVGRMKRICVNSLIALLTLYFKKTVFWYKTDPLLTKLVRSRSLDTVLFQLLFFTFVFKEPGHVSVHKHANPYLGIIQRS